MKQQNNLIRKKWLNVITVLSLFLGIGLGVFMLPDNALGSSDPLTKYKAQQAKLEKQMQAQQAQLAKAKTNLKDVSGQLNAISIKVNTKENELKSLKEQQTIAQHQLAKTNKELKTAQAKLNKRLTVFGNRLRESYVEGKVSIIDVFFASNSMEDFITRSYYFEKIADYDLDMMNEIKAQIATVNEKKATIVAQQNDLNEMRTIQEGIMASLNDAYSEQTKVVQSAQKDKEEAEKQEAALEQASKDIEKEIAKAQASLKWQGHGSGQYMWPLDGYHTISSPYGYRIHPVTGKKSFHTGIDIPAPTGTSIHAVDDGMVVLSQWYGAYGNCVVIDHGNNLTSLYGHMSQRLVSVGQKVSKGEVIGKVGSTGWSTGSHLHMEFRLNGVHTSPWNYLSK